MTGSLRSRLALAPPEGWLSVALVAVMAVTVGWSLDDAALVLGRREWTDFLPWAALGGVAVGFLGARFRWNRFVAHLIGAAFAALLVPLLVGGILAPGGSPGVRYEATAASTLNAVFDFAVRGREVTRETGHYLLVLGLLCWANGQYAAAAVFRQGRPVGPILVLGAALIANMSATSHDQIWLLVLFTMAALALLTRLHAADERATWIRRRIGDPATVGSLYLRGGTAFILVAVLGALTLTASARSAPLAGFWEDVRPVLVDVSQWLQRIIPAAPDSRPLGVPVFGRQVTIGGVWSSSDEPALDIYRQPGDDRPLYWRATAFDTFTLRGWTSSSPAELARPAGSSILEGTFDAIPERSKRVTTTFRIEPRSRLFRVAFSPIDPIAIDRDTTLVLAGEDGWFQSIALGGGDPYTVTVGLPLVADVEGGLTNNRLRAAGMNYPAEIKARYLDVPNGALGPAARALLADLKARAAKAGLETPFDKATLLVNELHSSRYRYATNVVGVCDDQPSIVECFALRRVGFCEYYASTMTILLRAQGIPARLVEGFLPGQVDRRTGRETISLGAAHAWVEVYFPGIGWHLFDPTGGGLSQAEELIEGTVVPITTPPPRPSGLASVGPDDDGPDGPSRRPGAGTVTTPPDGPAGGAPFIVVATVLLAAVLVLAFLAWRRGPRGATTADGVYTSVTGIARRFGFGPRPTQTAYEYATALGDVLPSARPELQTVAEAKVEVAYGRRDLDADRLRALRDSYRRLRVSLLRLALRRRERRRMR